MAEKPIAVEEIPLSSIIRLAVSLVALVVAEAAFAQSYPDKPVRIVVGFAAGGPTDVVARIVADKLSANLGKQFYVVNQPGVGSTPHLSGEIFRISNGLDLPTVQFTGAGPAMQSTVGGHTPVAFSAVPPAAPQIKEGLLRGLAVTAEKRSSALPDVPTMAEAGFPGQEAYTLTGILAPAATPKEIVALLHREIVKLVAMPDVQKRLDELGFEVVANSPDEFAARIKTEMEKWGQVIRDAKIKAE